MKLKNWLLGICAAVVLLLLLLPFRPYVGKGDLPARLPPLVTTPAHSRPPADDPLDLNTASEEALQTLPGIGPTRAKSIVDYRLHNGPFQSVEELAAVDGIGQGILDPIRHLLCVTPEH